ncbi:transposase, IS66 family [Methylomarinovum tepidoasis]|uniref:Transposase, IS66 family n=1 Tax=Methylomarinovum tepidoasis TaxID=2840183 RepID=A0AAU9CCP5_9GAMM|nr:DUF6444 domain-containing protein [Methylomarinovum sp. IN45]BCX88561.1 transposase, IS66 family [Methylomarinovum sp. IN45]
MEGVDLDLSRPPPLPETVEECRRVIEALWRTLGEFQQLKARVDELEEQLALEADNFSRPLSQDSPKQHAERKGRAQERAPGGALQARMGPASLCHLVQLCFFSQSHCGDRFRPMILSLVETCKRLKIGVYQRLRTICAQGMAKDEATFRLPLPKNRLLAGADSWTVTFE